MKKENARLRVRLLGPFQVTVVGEAVTGFTSDKARALLAYLIVEQDRPHRRESLAGLLWPDYPETSARGSLRNALAVLRQAIGDREAGEEGYLEISRQTIQFKDESDAWCDVTAFGDCLEAAAAAREPGDLSAIQQLEEAVALYRGSFLDGFTIADSEPFEHWVLLTRERLERQALQALGQLLDHYEVCGELVRALELAWRRVEMDPWREPAQSCLMRLLALNGQLGAAAAQYEAYRELLEKELDGQPSEHMQALYEQLLAGEVSPIATTGMRVVGRAPRQVGRCPYRGLAAFREADAAFFFGREGFIERLREAVARQPPVAVIVGPSGSGKSSAVFAGLLPRLWEEPGWLIAQFRPGAQPFQACAAGLLPLLELGLSETDRLIETVKLGEALREGNLSLYQVVERVLEKEPEAHRLLMLVDQFEELFTLCPHRALQRRFLDTLLDTVEAAQQRGGPFVLLALRADFMGQAMGHRPFTNALQDTSLLLGPMTREELRAAVVIPAEVQGAAFEEGLVERILDDVGQEPGNLPLLEFALTLLWERLNEGWMTHAAYEELGRVEGALARYADQVYAGLGVEEQEAARQVFVQLVRPGEGTEDTRRVAARSELGDEHWDLVQHLAGRRLVVTGRDVTTGVETVEVVHEALIQRWGQLVEWMRVDRAFRTWQERLRVGLWGWEGSGEDAGALLRGAPLAEAENWLAERGEELSAAEKGYVQASVALRQRRQAERERRRRRTVLGLALGLLLALVLALVAGQQWQRAEGQRSEALRKASVGLAAQALAEMEGSAPERSVLLALAALEDYPYTPQAERALANAVDAYRPYTELEYTGSELWKVAWSPDGTRVAGVAAGGPANWMLWDAGTNRLLNHDRIFSWPQPAPGCFPNDLAWSPDGERLVISSQTYPPGTESCPPPRIVDRLGRDRAELVGHTGNVNGLDWAPDGSTILTASDDGTVRLWRVLERGTSDRIVADLTLTVSNSPLWDVAWSPTSAQVAVAAQNGTVSIWDPESGDELLTLSRHAGAVTSVTWSPDGRYLATASADTTIRVWRLLGAGRTPVGALAGELLHVLSGHSDEVRGVDWSPDGQRIATISFDGTTRVWDAETGDQRLVLHSGGGILDSVTWSPDGGRLLADGGLSSVRVWELSRPERWLPRHSAVVFSAVWSSDERRAATVSADGAARIWDAATGKELLSLDHPRSPYFVDWSPDGTRIVTAMGIGAPRIWDIVKDERPFEMPLPEGESCSRAVWSPDGTQIAVANCASHYDKMLILDAATGESNTCLTGDTRWVIMKPSWSPAGDRIVAAVKDLQNLSDTPAVIWDTTTGEILVQLPSQDGPSLSAEWSPDGQRVVVGYWDGQCKVWDVDTGEASLTFTTHTDEVWDVSWSPDGTRVVSGDREGTVNVWDAGTGALVQSFAAPASVARVNWSPGGSYVIATGYFNTPVIQRAWQSTEQLVAYARECCVPRQLTPEERAQFGLPPR